MRSTLLRATCTPSRSVRCDPMDQIPLRTGSAAIPEAVSGRTPTTAPDQDAAIAALRRGAEAWATVGLSGWIALLEALVQSTAAVAERWVETGCDLKGIPRGAPAEAEEWFGGPYTILRHLQLLARALTDVRDRGAPGLPGLARTRTGGQVVAPVFPTDPLDRIRRGWRREPMRLSDSEWTVMQAVWGSEQAVTAREVHVAVELETDWAYSAVRTLLTGLCEKHALAEEMQGKQVLYVAELDRTDARRSAIRSLVDTAFGGTFHSLGEHLARDQHLSADDREDLIALLEKGDTGDDAAPESTRSKRRRRG